MAAHEIRVWQNHGQWNWSAWYGGTTMTGTGEDSLDARLSAMEWVGLQDRPPVPVVLDGVARVRKDYLSSRPIV